MSRSSRLRLTGLLVSSLMGLGALTAQAGVGLKQIAEGFTSPVVLVPMGDESGRLLVVDQVGVVHILSKDGNLEKEPFLDLRKKLVQLNQGFDERGVLGLALHPKHRENGKLYVYYSAPLRSGAPEGWNHTSHISEFKVSRDNPETVDMQSERIVLEIDQPQFNHDGGRMAFGPDNYLYIALGDGGAGNDEGEGHPPQGNGQDTSTLLGSILRLDVDSKQPYGIPSDNPFVNGGGRPEIFAYGFRNPWGISFDRGGERQLFAADVGQNAFEEVNIVSKGGNYGWRIREGLHCFDPKNPNTIPDDCPKVGARGEPLIDPIFEYKNFKANRNDPEALGISITGGYVYRGKAIPELQGKYVFADWSQNWALPQGILFVASEKGGKWEMKPLALASQSGGWLSAYVVAFGEDDEGELYVLTNGLNSLVGNTGKVFKLVPEAVKTAKAK